MSKTHAMFAAVVIVFCACVQVTAQVPAVTSSQTDRELLLIERIEKLERRLAELEAKLNPSASSSIETTPPAETKTTPLSHARGLFSGVTQALKEGTFTAEYKLADGFLVRGEYRRDWSNQPFFLTEQPGVLKKEQNTATLGLIWWFGRKQGTW